MNNMINHERRKAYNFNFKNDFQILSLKEKRVVIKNAKSLLKLQKEEGSLFYEGTPLPLKDNEI
jgi:hypothetical protein